MEGKTIMSESTEQQAVITWYGYQYSGNIIYAIPNGAWFGGVDKQKAIIYGAKRKREGLLKGVSDLFIPEPSGIIEINENFDKGGNVLPILFRYHGLYVEMKDCGKGAGSLSPDQRWFIEEMRKRGYRAEYAPGADAAIKIITEYLKGVE